MSDPHSTLSHLSDIKYRNRNKRVKKHNIFYFFILMASLPIFNFSLVTPSYAALNVTTIQSINLGIILSGPAGRQFILNTSGIVTGPDTADHINGQVVGEINVIDTTSPLSINILADNINAIGGLTVNQVLCSYNNGPQLPCSGTGMDATSAASASLKVGLDVSTTQTHNGGDVGSITIDITITYI
jgi:hypothetical protein